MPGKDEKTSSGNDLTVEISSVTMNDSINSPFWNRLKDSLNYVCQREVCFFLFLNALRSSVHPYLGFFGDAKIYALQVMNRVTPGFLDRDLFFAYGSQDNYSVFSILLAPLVSTVGLTWSFFLVYVAGTAFLIFAEMRLVRCLIPNRLAGNVTLILLAMTTLPYAGWGVLHVQEPFLTARLPAIALTLLGIEQLLRSRFAVALVLMLLAAVLHPLMAIGGLLVAVGAMCIAKLPRKVVLSIASTVALTVAAVLLCQPLGTLLLGYVDPEWYAIARRRSPFSYPSAWWPHNWYQIAFSLAVVAVATRYLDRRFTTVIRLVVLVALAGVAGSCLGETYPYALLLQGNPHRALWLLQFLAVPLGVLLLFRIWENGTSAVRLQPADEAHWQWRSGLARLTATVVLVCLMDAFVFRGLGDPFWLRCLVPRWCNGFLVVAGGTLLVIGLWFATKNTRKRCLLAAAVWVGASAATFFIQNDPSRWDPLVRDRRELDFVRRFVGEHWQDQQRDPVVYWPTDETLVWFGIPANSFFSEIQTAGMIYSRGTAIEGQRRALLVRSFEVENMRAFAQDGWFRNWFLGFYQTDMDEPPPTRQNLIDLCKEEQLDFVVLRQRFEDLVAGTNGAVFIYDCRSIRAREVAGMALPQPAWGHRRSQPPRPRRGAGSAERVANLAESTVWHSHPGLLRTRSKSGTPTAPPAVLTFLTGITRITPTGQDRFSPPSRTVGGRP